MATTDSRHIYKPRNAAAVAVEAALKEAERCPAQGIVAKRRDRFGSRSKH
jgi:hypothetical protein